MTDVASLGVWPLGTFAWCARSARAAPFRTRSLRAAILTSRLPKVLRCTQRQRQGYVWYTYVLSTLVQL